jgi:hypothetical protein
METLFEVSPKFPNKTCLQCENRQRHQKGGSIIQYCGVRKSNLTENKLLKIKAKNPACEQFKNLK